MESAPATERFDSGSGCGRAWREVPLPLLGDARNLPEVRCWVGRPGGYVVRGLRVPARLLGRGWSCRAGRVRGSGPCGHAPGAVRADRPVGCGGSSAGGSIVLVRPRPGLAARASDAACCRRRRVARRDAAARPCRSSAGSSDSRCRRHRFVGRTSSDALDLVVVESVVPAWRGTLPGGCALPRSETAIEKPRPRTRSTGVGDVRSPSRPLVRRGDPLTDPGRSTPTVAA